MASAPQAIWNVYNAVTIASKRMGGIVGDSAHSFGYHLARNQLPPNDYSVVLGLDKSGASDCASALDLSLSDEQMVIVTNRLLAAAIGHDPRLSALREFCGTTDNVHTHPYDLSNRQDGPLDSWDNSHLHHVHLSFYRTYANNPAALNPIVAVINGAPLQPKDWFEMATRADLDAAITAALPAIVSAVLNHKLADANGKVTVGTVGQAIRDTREMVAALRDAVKATTVPVPTTRKAKA
jgi:hypothetical protein